VPGRVVDYRITPDLIGEYTLRCAELCGLKHALMEKTVRVVSQADYDKWIADNTQKPLRWPRPLLAILMRPVARRSIPRWLQGLPFAGRFQGHRPNLEGSVWLDRAAVGRHHGGG